MSDGLLQPEGGNGFKWSERSQRNLSTVDPRMRMIMTRALRNSPYDFAITSGKRTEKEQKQLYGIGRPDWRKQQGVELPEGREDRKPVTWTLNSRHLSSDAVDILPFPDGKKGSYSPRYYKAIAKEVEKAAKDMGYKVEWGGRWKKRDWAHFELVPDPNLDAVDTK